MYVAVKIVVTAVLVVAVSELAKRSSFMGALLASVPLVSVLAILWLYFDTQDISKVSALASSIFWLVLPSLAFFLLLPWLLKTGVNFYLSLGCSIAVTAVCYGLVVAVLGRFGIGL